MMSSIFKNDEDNVYYNIVIKNDEPNVIEARFNENRVQPILDHPNEYEVAVVRFSVPSYNIPIMFFRNNTGDYVGEFYTITLSFDGVDITKQLQFIQNENPPLYKKETIWNYQEMIDIINVSLKDAFTDLKNIKPLAPPTEAPFFTYDAKTKLISLYAQQLYDTNGVPTIEIFCNDTLFRLFPTFQVKEDESLGIDKLQQFLVKDNKLNSTTYNGSPYYIMEQESETLYLWYDFQSIAFETNNIPVNPEFLPAQNNVISRIITDFEPLSDDPSRQIFQFFPQGPLRYYDLRSAYPLKAIDLIVRWIDKERRSYPLYLSRGDLLTTKILFRKKSERVLREALTTNQEEEN
jgi:hypothetical protein